MVLFGVMIGRSTGMSCVADSYLSTYTRVCSRSPAPLRPVTLPRCVFASASGRILIAPPLSTAEKPCSRSAERKMSYAADTGTGCDETMLTVPFTRGSSRKLRFTIWPIAVATASMSAFTKLSVTRSSSAARAQNASAKLKKKMRLAAPTALQLHAFERAVVAHHHVVRVHFLQHVAAGDGFADVGAARLSVEEEHGVSRRDQADELELRARRGLGNARGAEEIRFYRRRLRDLRLQCRSADRARSEREPRPVGEERRDGGDERQLDQQKDASSHQPVLEPAVHVYSVYR